MSCSRTASSGVTLSLATALLIERNTASAAASGVLDWLSMLEISARLMLRAVSVGVLD